MLVAGQQCQHLPDAEWEAASIKGRCRHRKVRYRGLL